MFAGSWHSRGHSSSLGIGLVIDAHTSSVIDFQTLSKTCQTCAGMRTKLAKKKIMQQQFDAWKKEHEAVCTLSYEGSSGGMEETAAVTIWERSLQKKLRYVTYIGDGDCSSYNAVSKLNDNAGPYGHDKPVIKEECVNHVHKRMGTALRKLVKETTEEYKTAKGETRQKKLLGGRGRLTENTIDKLTSYYGAAIRRNVGKTVKEMSDDIWATFYHCSSTDERPNHIRCPKGEDSWCFYRRAEAQHEKEEEEKKKREEETEAQLGGPSEECKSFYGGKKKTKSRHVMPSHSTMKVSFQVGKEERLKIKAVYERLTAENLLGRCLKGKTQNPNESLHSRVWKLCPKSKSLGKLTLDFAVAQAVTNYNIGYKAAFLGNELGIENNRILKVLEGMDKRREQVIQRKAKKKKKTLEIDPKYGPGMDI